MNYKYLIIILFIFVLLLPFSFASENQTVVGDGEASNNENSYYFDASCENDNGNGSSTNPYKYLTADRIRDNSNIYLKEGEYKLDLAKSINNVNIYGSNNQNTTIGYSGVAFVVSNGNFKVENITLSNLTIVNSLNFNAKNVIFDSGKGHITDRYNNCFGGAVYSTGSNSMVTIDNCTFKDTHAEYGGAIYQGGGNLLITNSEFINSSSFNFGGSIACLNTNNIRISKSKFTNSYSIGDAGGAIYIKSSVLNGDDLTFENCSSTFGSAISSLSSEVSLTNIKASNNSVKFSGGAIYHMYGTFSISGSKFVNNTALNGGALFIDSSKNCTITNNIFNDNSALLCGGAGYVLLCNLTENSNSFNQNHALQADDLHNSSSINMVIGSGNYTMVKVDSTEIDEIPSYFSLIDKHLVSPVADQQSGGNCWAFAPIAVLESCLLKATGDTVDLSEENIKNLMALYSDYGWNVNTNDGGNFYMVLGYLTSWMGPIFEKDDLYDDKSHLSDVLSSIYHVQNVMFLKRNSYTDNDAIKLALMKYGAVGTTMSAAGYITSGNAYYYWGNDDVDHAVAIVGWDDNFSRYNFARTAPGDGAWIVKNSWGSGWGNNGYFYVSYYDTRFAQPGVIDASFIVIFNDTIRLDKNYQYDISGITDFFVNSSSKVWYKNIFTSTDEEYLASVSTYFDKIANWTVSIYVNGQYRYDQSGVSNPGYYTINLDKLIPLAKGDVFEVIFNVSVNGEAYFPVSEVTRFNNMLYSPNISFVSYDGINWVDLYDCSWKYSSHRYDSQVACIKAFTILNPINTTASIGYDFEGNLINIRVNVLDQYGNSLKSGSVALNVNGKIFNIDVKNGYANLDYISNKTDISISAIFNAVGYNPSNDAISFNIPKFKLPLNVTVSRTLNNVSIEFSSLNHIDMSLKATINSNVHEVNLKNGKATLKLNNLANNVYNMNVTILNNPLWELDFKDSFTVDIRNVKFITNNIIITDDDNIIYNITIMDEKGNLLSNKKIAITLNDKFDVTSDGKGIAHVPIHLNAGNYTLYADFKGDNDYLKNSTSANVYVKCKVDGSVSVDKYQDNANITVRFSKLINDVAKFIVNGKPYNVDVKNGVGILNINNLKNGKYDVSISLDDNYVVNDIASSFNVNVVGTKIVSSDVVSVDDGLTCLSARLVDGNSNPVKGQLISFNVANKVYSNYTGSDGFARVYLSLAAGQYTVNYLFGGNDNYFKSNSAGNVNVKSKVVLSLTKEVFQNSASLKLSVSKSINDVAKFVINSKTYTVNVKDGVAVLDLSGLANGQYSVDGSLVDAGAKYVFSSVASSFSVNVVGTKVVSSDVVSVDDGLTCVSVRLVDGNSNPVKGQLISFNVANKVYSNVTGADGFARVYLNLAAGDYKGSYLFEGTNNYFKSTSSGNIKVKSRVVLSLSKDVFQNSASLKLSVSKSINDVAKFVVNGKAYSVNVNKGVVVLDLSGLANGKYSVDVSLVDANGKYAFSNVVSSFDVNVVATKVVSSNVVSVDDGLTCVSVRLVDVNSNPVKGQLISFNVANKVYSNVTGADGFARVYLNLAAGDYKGTYLFEDTNNYFKSSSSSNIKVKSKVSLSFDSTVYQNSATLRFGVSKSIKDSLIVKINDNVTVVKVNDVISLNNLPNGVYNVVVSLANPNDYVFDELKGYFKIDVVQTKIICDELSAVYSKNNQYSIVLKDIYANPVKNQPIEFVIGNKTYQKITDNNGKAQISINLNCGDYPVVINYLGNNNYFKSSAKSAIHIRTSIIAEDSSTKAYNSKYSVKFSNTSKATFIINKVSYNVQTDKDGYASINILEKPGNYELTIINDFTGEKITKTIKVVSRITANKDITKYYLGSKTYQVRVLNDNGAVASGVYVKISIAGKTYNVKTNSKGIATLKLKFNPGKYTITTSYKGFKVSNKVVIKTNIITKSLSKKKSKTAKFNVKLLDGNGKIFKFKIVTVKFKGKKYSIKTNSKGIASLTLNKNLRVGKYNIVTSYGGLSVKNIIRVVK